MIYENDKNSKKLHVLHRMSDEDIKKLWSPLIKMSRQQMADRILGHFARGGKRSLDSDFDCKYRGPNGEKCAAGVILPDSLCVEGRSVIGIPGFPFKRYEGKGKLLIQLQQTHDNLDLTNKQMLEKMREIVRSHGLEVKY